MRIRRHSGFDTASKKKGFYKISDWKALLARKRVYSRNANFHSFFFFFGLSGSFPLNNLTVFDRQIKITLEKDLMNNTSKLYNTFFAERADFPWFIIPDKHRLLHTWIPAGRSPVTSTIWKTRRKSMAMLHWYYPTLMRMHSGAKNSWCSWITSLETLSSLWAWLSQL